MLRRITLISLIILFPGFIQNVWADRQSVEKIGLETLFLRVP